MNIRARCAVAAAIACTLAFAGAARAAASDDESLDASPPAEEAPTGIPVCMPLPRVAIGDNKPIVSAFSETLREQVAAFVAGPLVDVRGVGARLPVQARAEAARAGCRYLLNVSFAHRPDSRLGRRTADTAMAVGSVASSVVDLGAAGSAIGAAGALGGLFPGSDSDGGGGLYPVGRNDRVTLEYSLEPVGKQASGAPRTGSFAAKATRDNEPLVESLVEKLSTEIVEKLAPEAPQ